MRKKNGHLFYVSNRHLIWAVNKTRIGLWIGSDSGSDRIGSDWQFALNSRQNGHVTSPGMKMAERRVCIQSSVTNLVFLFFFFIVKWSRYFLSLLERRWHLRCHSLIDNKSSLSYLAYYRDFLNRLLWKEAFNPSSVRKKTNSEESGDEKKNKIIAMRDTYISVRHLRFGRRHVTKPLFGIVIVWSYATENFPVQFSWK